MEIISGTIVWIIFITLIMSYGLFPKKQKDDSDLLIILVNGLVNFSIFSYFLSLFLKVNNEFRLILVLVAAINLIRLSKLKFYSSISKITTIVISLLIIGYFSTSFPTNIDSINYHYSIIEIHKNFNLIFGIGNLNPHYALDSQIFITSAILDILPNIFIGSKFANGLYVAIYVIICLEIFESKRYSEMVKTYFSLTLGIILVHSFSNPSLWLSSPAQDLTALILVFLVIGIMLMGNSLRQQKYYYLCLNLVFVSVLYRFYIIALGIILFAYLIKYRKIELRKTYPIPLISVLLVAINNIKNTGYPFYPSDLLRSNAIWVMNQTSISEIYQGIANWQQNNLIGDTSRFSQFNFSFIVQAILNDGLFALTITGIGIGSLILILQWKFGKNRGSIQVKFYYHLLLLNLLNLLLIYTISPQFRFLWSSMWMVQIFLFQIIVLNMFSLSQSKIKTVLRKFIPMLPLFILMAHIILVKLIFPHSIFESFNKSSYNVVKSNTNIEEERNKLKSSIGKAIKNGNITINVVNSDGCGYTKQFCVAKNVPVINFINLDKFLTMITIDNKS